MTPQDLPSTEAPDAYQATTPVAPGVPLARRVVLRAGATVPLGVGLVSLAACGSDSGTESGASEGESEADDDASAADEGNGSSAGGDAAAGFPSTDVPVGGAAYDEASETVYSSLQMGRAHV